MPEDERDPTYFQYYAQFVHQQNMLQDHVRTSMYYSSILNNPSLFSEQTVMDVGAGSGILSFFAVQAGATHVYAIEASGMASRIQKLLSDSTKNPLLQNKITVVQSKIEDVSSVPKVDVIISEPIGVFLVHERMIESFIHARDHFLKPGGKLLPSCGTIYVAPFTDGNLWTQTMNKVRFWEQSNFYGVDLSPLSKDAKNEIFGQPIVGGFDEKQLMAPACSHLFDFETISMQELKDFVIPFSWNVGFTGIIHGIASWFDIDLCGYILSTAPHLERTHWHQVRLMLKEPLAVNAGQIVRGWLHFTVNPMRSYDIRMEMVVGDTTVLSDPKSKIAVDGGVRRMGYYSLHEQSYFFDYYQYPVDTKPEMMGLYETEVCESPIEQHDSL